MLSINNVVTLKDLRPIRARNYIISLLIFLFCSSTLNAQTNWTILNSWNNSEWLRSIDFSDSLHVWIGDNRGRFFYTEDGGETWIKKGRYYDYYFRHYDFIDSSVGWAVASNNSGGALFKSTNGGATWNLINQISAPDYFSMCAAVSSDICIAGVSNGKMAITKDGGLSWSTTVLDSTSVYPSVV